MTARVAAHIVAFATRGAGSGDEERLLELLSGSDAHVWSIERSSRARTAARLAVRLLRTRPDLVVMEGTGVLGGVALLLYRCLGGQYIVCSGDAVGPYIASISPALGWPAAAYERLLCRLSAGYVGWTPYLTGRAVTFGAPRAITLPGWGCAGDDTRVQEAIRASWGARPDDIVFGLVGSLNWRARRGYCYGLELVQAAARVQRDDVVVVIMGDGDGRARLRQLVAASGARVLLPGPVPHAEVPAVLSAMDIGSLPQSVDAVGMFRYSAKLPEYLAAGLPVVTGELPAAYDLDGGWVVRLPGASPWDARYVTALSELMATISQDDVAALKASVPRHHSLFDRGDQQRRLQVFIGDLLAAAG